jgi:hypothetical protein
MKSLVQLVIVGLLILGLVAVHALQAPYNAAAGALYVAICIVGMICFVAVSTAGKR